MSRRDAPLPIRKLIADAAKYAQDVPRKDGESDASYAQRVAEYERGVAQGMAMLAGRAQGHQDGDPVEAAQAAMSKRSREAWKTPASAPTQAPTNTAPARPAIVQDTTSSDPVEAAKRKNAARSHDAWKK